MNTPTKVTLEVTADQFTWRVFDRDNNTITEKTMRRLAEGGARGDRTNFEKDVDDEDLIEAIDDGDAYNIMAALSMM